MVFPSKQVKRPAKRKQDDVEIEAELVLKKIKKKSIKDGNALDEARMPVPKRVREICSQSNAFCEAIASEYGTELPPPTVLNRDDFKNEMEAYIEHSFIAWGWNSNAKHQAELNKWKKRRDNKKEPLPGHIVTLINRMIKALINERKKFTKRFANEFKFTQKTLVKSVKFDEANDTFYALLRWIEETPVYNAAVAKVKSQSNQDDTQLRKNTRLLRLSVNGSKSNSGRKCCSKLSTCVKMQPTCGFRFHVM